MAVKLNRTGLEFGKKLVSEGMIVRDESDAWSEDQPSADEENAFIRDNGFEEYAKWHLGIEEKDPEDTKRRYKFPFGNFKRVHRCAVLSVESRAGEYRYRDIELAAAHLHGMLDGTRHQARGA